MEPRQTGPGASYEHMPAPSLGGEGYSLPDVDPGIGLERRQEALESRPAPVELPVAPPAIPMAPVPLPQTDDSATSATAQATTAPDSAADEDLIEKEWVDKAKKIIEQTKDDPHARTQKVNELQRDYLQKRFGKVVGASE